MLARWIAKIRNPDADPLHLSAAAIHQWPSIRRIVAGHPNTPPQVLADLAEDDDHGVLVGIAANPNAPSCIIDSLIDGYPDDAILRAAFDNPATPIRKLYLLAAILPDVPLTRSDVPIEILYRHANYANGAIAPDLLWNIPEWGAKEAVLHPKAPVAFMVKQSQWRRLRPLSDEEITDWIGHGGKANPLIRQDWLSYERLNRHFPHLTDGERHESPHYPPDAILEAYRRHRIRMTSHPNAPITEMEVGIENAILNPHLSSETIEEALLEAKKDRGLRQRILSDLVRHPNADVEKVVTTLGSWLDERQKKALLARVASASKLERLAAIPGWLCACEQRVSQLKENREIFRMMEDALRNGEWRPLVRRHPRMAARFALTPRDLTARLVREGRYVADVAGRPGLDREIALEMLRQCRDEVMVIRMMRQVNLSVEDLSASSAWPNPPIDTVRRILDASLGVPRNMPPSIMKGRSRVAAA